MPRTTQLELKAIAERLVARIAGAHGEAAFFEEPYKHLVIDNALGLELADRCLQSFPALEDPIWERAHDEDIEIKYRTMWNSEFDIPEHIVDAVRIMNCSLFLNAMTVRFDIPKIVPDPYFTGGGLNVSTRGGLLDVHVDGNYHDATGLNRRLNAILYLNPEWKPDWGGEFGVYDNEGRECVKRIAPLHDRLVIFDSHDFSFHGLPEPINFPADVPRRSIILYYYTKEPRPEGQVAVSQPHSALWKKRRFLDKRGNKTRAFS
jgi:Rps23 Pro-64 3,4-dihydroxylase Tpa1-like proline 4-hydroxylase